jgi:NTE family protein
MFQANAISEKRKCDLLIETNGLQDYSNHELEKVEEIFLKGYNAANDILYALKQEKRTIWNTPL